MNKQINEQKYVCRKKALDKQLIIFYIGKLKEDKQEKMVDH